MPRKDSVTARLKSLIEEERIRKRVELSAKCFWGPLLDPASDLDPILQRALDLSAVVQLKSNEVALKKAFKSFDLAPDVPGHWHLLINYLARSLFETKRAGAKRRWTFEKHRQLLQDARVAAKKCGGKDVQAWVRYLRKDPSFGERYKGLKPESLRRKIYHTIKLFNAAGAAR